jgi:hypothetical protein
MPKKRVVNVPELQRSAIYERVRVAMGYDEVGAPAAVEELCRMMRGNFRAGIEFTKGDVSFVVDNPGPLDDIFVEYAVREMRDYLHQAVMKLPEQSRVYRNRFSELTAEHLRNRAEWIREAIGDVPGEIEVVGGDDDYTDPAIVVGNLISITGYECVASGGEDADLLRDMPTLKQESWLVSRIVSHPGSFVEPPSEDLQDIRTFPTLTEAMLFAQGEVIRNRLALHEESSEAASAGMRI